MGGVAEGFQSAREALGLGRPASNPPGPPALKPPGVKPIRLDTELRERVYNLQLVGLSGVIARTEDEPRAMGNRRGDNLAVETWDIVREKELSKEVMPPKCIISLVEQGEHARRAD
jgi:hypothetical protein